MLLCFVLLSFAYVYANGILNLCVKGHKIQEEGLSFNIMLKNINIKRPDRNEMLDCVMCTGKGFVGVVWLWKNWAKLTKKLRKILHITQDPKMARFLDLLG